MNHSFLKKMVWENDFQSLCDCIERTIESIETIFLWQAEENKLRQKHEAFIQKFSPEKGILQLIEVDQKVFNFKEDEEVFIRFNDRSLLFKAIIRKMSRERLQVILPKKFRIIENRDQSRSNLLEQAIKVKIDLDVENKTKNSSFVLDVLDINRDGLGVVFSITKAKNFIVGEDIFITSFGDVSLDENIRCKIVHVTKMDRRVDLVTSREYKMGLKFLGEIPFFMNSYEA